MASVSKTYTFSNGGLIYASEHNTNFDTLYTLANGNIDNDNISATAAIAYSKLAALASGKILVGNVSGVATAVNLSGNGTITNAGVLSINNLSLAGQAQGDILYYDGSTWANLAAGTDGYYLKTQGAEANPTWASVSAGITAPASSTDNSLARWNGIDASALDSCSSLTVSDNGEMVNTSQPAFMAYPSSAQTNISVGSNVTVVFGTERFDQGSDFASNTFTAPVTGKYLLSFSLRIEAIDSASDYYKVIIKTSNDDYETIFDPGVLASDPDYWLVSASVVADMDASDTAYIVIYQGSGTQQTDIGTASWFSGALIC